MKSPQSWKNLLTVERGSMADSDEKLKRRCGRRRSLGRCGRRRRRLGGGLRVVADLAAEDFAVDRRERLVEDADERPAAEVAGARLLPRHDVGDLGQLAVADD